MSELFAIFKQHLLWSLTLWLMVFIAFVAMFARGRLVPFAGGLWRIFIAVVTSPFVFIGKATTSVVSFDREQESEYRTGEQYLLNKAMLIVQAIVIVATIGAFSAAMVATWNVLVPPSEVRQNARDYRAKVDEQRGKAATSAAEVSTLDAEWSRKQTGVVASYRGERQRTIHSSNMRMTAIERDVANTDATAASIIRWAKGVPAYSDLSSASTIRATKRWFDQTVRSNWWSLTESARHALPRWNDAWHSRAAAQFELRNIPLNDLRRDVQPQYDDARIRNESAAERVRTMEAWLAQHEEAARLKWKAAMWTAVRAFLKILLFVWIIGLAIEAAWLAIRVAGDVRRIRQLTDRDSRTEPAPAREPRMAMAGVATEVMTARTVV
jgi:hypothetical protein